MSKCWLTRRLPTEEWFCIICFIRQWQLPDSRQHLHQFHLLSLCISTMHVCLYPSGSYYNHGICRDAERWGHQGGGPGLSKWVRQHTDILARTGKKYIYSSTVRMIFWYLCLSWLIQLAIQFNNTKHNQQMNEDLFWQQFRCMTFTCIFTLCSKNFAE